MNRQRGSSIEKPLRPFEGGGHEIAVLSVLPPLTTAGTCRGRRVPLSLDRGEAGKHPEHGQSVEHRDQRKRHVVGLRRRKGDPQEYRRDHKAGIPKNVFVAVVVGASAGRNWKDYKNPDYPDVANSVDLYRVPYRSTIPEQGNRPTVASFTLNGLTAGQQIQFRVFSVSRVGNRSMLGLSSNVAVMG